MSTRNTESSSYTAGSKRVPAYIKRLITLGAEIIKFSGYVFSLLEDRISGASFSFPTQHPKRIVASGMTEIVKVTHDGPDHLATKHFKLLNIYNMKAGEGEILDMVTFADIENVENGQRYTLRTTVLHFLNREEVEHWKNDQSNEPPNYRPRFL